MVLQVRFVKYNPEGEEIRTEAYFHSTNRVLVDAAATEDQYQESSEEVLKFMEEFQREGSGWAVERVLVLEVFLLRYRPLRGSSYLPTPACIGKKKCTINVKNHNDQKCFVWSVLAALHPGERNLNRVNRHRDREATLNMTGISFPVQISDINRFEKQNPISVNVFGFETQEEGVFPLRITQEHKPDHVNLLLISDGAVQHYIAVSSLSRFLRREVDSHKRFYCPYCLHGFMRADLLERHQDDCRPHGPQKMVFPGEEDKWLKFDNVKAMLPAPFVIYADLESYVEPIQTCSNAPGKSSTERTHKHTPSGFCYMVVSQDPRRSKEAVVYRGPDVMERLVESLLDEVEDIKRQLKNPTPIQMTPEDEASFLSAKECFVCEELLGRDRVRDHDHLTGKFRGAAHSRCNLLLQPRMGKDACAFKVPVVFHNLKGYDANHIMKVVGKYGQALQISCIAQNMEKYITFTLGNLKFVDSLQFLNTSLQSLVSNLSRTGDMNEKFYHLHRHFNDWQGDILRRKGVYPYSYVTDEDKMSETALPPKEAFFNDLAQEHVSEEDYRHAVNVWESFGLSTFGNYHDLYLKTDVLLLADVFENFRRLCLKTYKLDPAHYVSSPGLSWDSMLKTTKVELELITDPDMFLFLEKGIRGGISMISQRHAEANNPYLGNTADPTSPNSYIAYWDANNLYGWSMSQPLPHSEFRWLSRGEVDSFDVAEASREVNTGFILEVDLDYPPNLHDLHNDYPMVPEQTEISRDMLSQYTRALGAKVYGSEDKIPTSHKLLPHLGPRKKYVIHIQNLQQCLQHGLKLSRIHRILAFHQRPWLEPYIRLNTNLRKLAVDDFEKDFFKLMNNSVFGKSCENLRNRRNIELVVGERRLLKLTARPSFKNVKIFSSELVGVEFQKTSIKMNRPVYTGLATLELSKTLMYEFHYDVIKKKYGGRADLLFTDTDSLCYHIQTEDLYRDMWEMRHLFDTSNYPRNHFMYSLENAKVLGKMKDELASYPAREFVGLRPKMYSILANNMEEKKTAKGVSRAIVRKVLRHSSYKNVLQEGGFTLATMSRIRAHKHQLYTECVRKVALSAYEDKRFVLDGGVRTLAHGHYKTGTPPNNT